MTGPQPAPISAASGAARFPNGCVAAPHHLAASAGAAVLAEGGNAVDAAVAANLVLAVVTPHACGVGGDLFALVYDGGTVHALDAAGRAPAAATRQAVLAALDAPDLGAATRPFPEFGPHTVTVPGAVDGWFTLLERFGTRSFGALAATAIGYASDGFVLSETGVAGVDAVRGSAHVTAGWRAVYGDAAAGSRLVQPALATTLETLAAQGPEPFYRGAMAAAIVETLRASGGLHTIDDLIAGLGASRWRVPITARYREATTIVEMPPPTQGIAVLQALRMLDALGPLPSDGGEREHRLIEVVRATLSQRGAHLADPAHMRTTVDALLDGEHIGDLASRIDPERAATLAPARPLPGGTVYLCAADADGMIVSLIQSNYRGFGSGITVAGWGITLHNRGAGFRLDPDAVGVVGPGRQPPHTLIPAMALRNGRPWMAFGAMGGDGQAQTQVQLLTRLVDDGADVADALAAPRWFVSPFGWEVLVEPGFPAATLDGLRAKGHMVHAIAGPDSLMGHANAIVVDPAGGRGYQGASDPRTEGACSGW